MKSASLPLPRIALLVALALSAAVPAFAQQTAKMPLVGVLRINTLATNEPGATMLRDALAAVGRVEGDNLRLEFRLAEGHAERYPALVEQLMRDGASVIIACGVPSGPRGTLRHDRDPDRHRRLRPRRRRIDRQLGQARRQHHRRQHPRTRARHQKTRHPKGDPASGTTLRRADGAGSQLTQVAPNGKTLFLHGSVATGVVTARSIFC